VSLLQADEIKIEKSGLLKTASGSLNRRHLSLDDSYSRYERISFIRVDKKNIGISGSFYYGNRITPL